MNHFATPDFWYSYRHMPAAVRERVDKNFALMRLDPHHPSLARDRAEGLVWFWIGPHSEYDQLLRRKRGPRTSRCDRPRE